MGSRQMSPSEIGDRKSFSEQEKTERLVMPSEFAALQKFEAIIKISNYGVAKLTVPKVFYKERHQPFIEREYTNEALLNPLPSTENTEEDLNLESAMMPDLEVSATGEASGANLENQSLDDDFRKLLG
jgi:hypothetical protein